MTTHNTASQASRDNPHVPGTPEWNKYERDHASRPEDQAEARKVADKRLADLKVRMNTPANKLGDTLDKLLKELTQVPSKEAGITTNVIDWVLQAYTVSQGSIRYVHCHDAIPADIRAEDYGKMCLHAFRELMYRMQTGQGFQPYVMAVPSILPYSRNTGPQSPMAPAMNHYTLRFSLRHP